MGTILYVKRVLLTPRHVSRRETRYMVRGKPMPDPRMLRIASMPPEVVHYLVYCDEEGNALKATPFRSLEQALSQAEWEFAVGRGEWIDDDATEEVPDRDEPDEPPPRASLVDANAPFHVELVETGERISDLIGLLGSELGIGLRDARQLAKSCPVVIKSFTRREPAADLAAAVAREGGLAAVREGRLED